MEPLLTRRKEIDEELKTLQTSMDKLRGELNAVYEKLGAKKEKKEEKKEKDDPYQKINDEQKELFAKIDAKRQEKREVRNAFFEQKHQFNEFTSKNRRMRVARSILERKQREQEELEQQRKEEEEMLKRHPFEKELAVCDDLLAYLKVLASKSAVATAPSAKPAFEVPEGMTLLKREEEVLYAEEPKKKKKDRRERKQKKTALTHDLGTLQSFAMVHVKAPTTEEDIPATVELVKTRKVFFDALPRGADVVAELAKQ